VVHETVYQALYVQGRGELRRELTRALRAGRPSTSPAARVATISGTEEIADRPSV
jgi:IS30 family transposase